MPFDKDIERSGTLSSEYYFDQGTWEKVKGKVFGRSWIFVGDRQRMLCDGINLYPFMLLDGYLEEPLVLADDGEVTRCLSNVCTHRAFLLTAAACKARKLKCKYHGRRFSLTGKFEFMPEFDDAEDFPRTEDHLAELPLESWHDFLFTGLDPAVSFDSITDKLDERLSFLDWNRFRHAPEYSKTYHVKAHWALYVENYLEGFHIPFVHAALNSLLDYGSYTTECYSHMVLQTGYTDKGGGECFDLPAGHPDHGREVTGYYYWIFPNLMLNFYTWGLQINTVRPVSMETCKVDFEYYIYDEEAWSRMDGERIAEITQIEDELVVEGVQKGLTSKLYPGGRFSPKREKGVHFFQMLLKEYLED